MSTLLTSPRKGEQAFTRLELGACILAIAVLVTVIAPGLANSGARNDRVVCFNNLRQIGVGYSQFGLEHQDLPPWRLPMLQGGNNDHPLKNDLSFQFSILSNSLATPRPLSDPADTRAGLRSASHWGTTSGGLLHWAFGRNAVSYFLALDGHFRVPRAILAGDRNVIAVSGLGSSTLPNPHSGIVASSTAWTNDVHGLDGNLLFYDGSVDQVDSAGLRAAVGAPDVTQLSNPPTYRALFP